VGGCQPPAAPASELLYLSLIASALYFFRSVLSRHAGSSIQDPLYAQHENAEDVPLGSLPDAKVMRPSKKAQLLRMTTRRVSLIVAVCRSCVRSFVCGGGGSFDVWMWNICNNPPTTTPD
jgi:hypothetical protein